MGSWGLDRIDRRDTLNAYDQKFRYFPGSSTPHIYIIDSGISFYATSEFDGRIGNHHSVVASSPTIDCSGHGTRVAGIAASTTYGVAKNAIVHSVKDLTCHETWIGVGEAVAAMDWIADNHIDPAVTNLSQSWPDWWDSNGLSSLEHAARELVSAGVVLVVSAGNDNHAACSDSPGDQEQVITVAAAQHSYIGHHNRLPSSNYGACIDIFAPGDGNYTISNEGGLTTISQTSGAAPFVTGVVALMRSRAPYDSPQAIEDHLVGSSTIGAINTGTLNGSPNRFVYSLFSLVRINGRVTIDTEGSYSWTASGIGGSGNWSQYQWSYSNGGSYTVVGSSPTYTRYVDPTNHDTDFWLQVRIVDSVTSDTINRTHYVQITQPGCPGGQEIC